MTQPCGCNLRQAETAFKLLTYVDTSPSKSSVICEAINEPRATNDDDIIEAIEGRDLQLLDLAICRKEFLRSAGFISPIHSLA